MRTSILTALICVALLALPAITEAKIATARTTVVEVYAPGSAKGMQFGAIAIRWSKDDDPRGVLIVKLTDATRITAPSKEDRVTIKLTELKPGTPVVMMIFGNRVGDTSWKTSAIHVIDPEQDPDATIRKAIGIGATFIGQVLKAGPPDEQRKNDTARLEVKKDSERFVFNVNSTTEIVSQSSAGKQRPVRFSEVKTGDEVVVTHFGPRGKSDPPQALAIRIIILERGK
jgi:hypothetical protein